MDPFGRILKIGGMIVGVAMLFAMFADVSHMMAQLIRENFRDMLLVGAVIGGVIWIVKLLFGDNDHRGGHPGG